MKSIIDKKALPFGICLIVSQLVLVLMPVFGVDEAIYFVLFFSFAITFVATGIHIVVSLSERWKTGWIKKSVRILGIVSLVFSSPIIYLIMVAIGYGINDSFGLNSLVSGKKEAVVTLVESKKDTFRKGVFEDYRYDYKSYILIENTPNDNAELKRFMIRKFVYLTAAIDSMRPNSDLDYASCMFLKSTSETKERFSDTRKTSGETYTSPGSRNSYGWYNNKTYIGEISIERCEEDSVKLFVEMSVNLGTTNYDDFMWYRGPGPDGKEKIILLNECEPDWYESNKDNEFVELFGEYYNNVIKYGGRQK